MELKLWKELMGPYSLAVKELTVKFHYLMMEYHNAGRYCPIEDVTGRVKSVTSILEKARRKQIPLDRLEDEMYDIAGIRLICQFVEDIGEVVELIRERSDIEIVEERDYIAHSKPSGYRSYHLIVRYEVQTMNGPKKLYAEIQVRTLGMNFWSIIEHSIQYKYKEEIPEHISRKLMKAAQAIVVLDSEMSMVRDEIMDAQLSMQHQQNIVSEILSNLQGLYSKANLREIRKIQTEFYEIYQMQDLEKLERFARELDIIAEGYQAQTIESIDEEDE